MDPDLTKSTKAGGFQATKRQFRQEMLRKRRAISEQNRRNWDRQIFDWFCSWSVYRNSETVMFYAAMTDEVQTEELITDALTRGKKVFVPMLGEKYGEMTAVEIGKLNDLVTGKFGLKMPKPGYEKSVESCTLDLVVVPAVAFDRRGNRMGMGAGYYDRFIPQTDCRVLLGIAWECQIVDRILCEEHDIPVDYLLTEQGFLTCRD